MKVDAAIAAGIVLEPLLGAGRLQAIPQNVAIGLLTTPFAALFVAIHTPKPVAPQQEAA